MGWFEKTFLPEKLKMADADGKVKLTNRELDRCEWNMQPDGALLHCEWNGYRVTASARVGGGEMVFRKEKPKRGGRGR